MCAKNNRDAAKICFICGNVRRRAALRIRYNILRASIRKLQAGRNAQLKSRRVAPIMQGVRKYYRKNAFGNIELPPITISPKAIYIAPRMRKPCFKRIFKKARPSPRFSGSYNFLDCGVFKGAVKQIMSIVRRLKVKNNITDDIGNSYLRGNVFEYMCSKKDFLYLQYVRAFYIFLMYTRLGKYVRTFGPRSFEWEDINNIYDPWLHGWRFELIDQIWSAIWELMPKRQGEYYMSGVKVPGRVDLRRIWRRNDCITDESVKQVARYLIEELIDPAYWNMAYSLVF